MKCRFCGKELNQSGGYCPQCGFKVNANDFESILREIVRLKGEEILRDGKVLLSMLSDIAPALRKERNLLSYLIKVNGNKTILDAGKRGESDLQEAIQRTAMQISDEYSVDPSKAEEICVLFTAVAFPNADLKKPAHQKALKKTGKEFPPCGYDNESSDVTCSKYGGKMNGEETKNPASETNTQPGGRKNAAPGRDNSTENVKAGSIGTNGQAKKRMPLWVLIALVLLLARVLYLNFHNPVYPVIAAGKCGDQCSWELSQDGVLTISGSGIMYDYDSNNNAPWNDYRETIHTVVVKNGITIISEGAFWSLDRLTKVVLPRSLVIIFSETFEGCVNLREFEISSINPYFRVKDGVLFSKDMTLLKFYPAGKTAAKYVVPNSVTLIGTRAFHSSRINEVVLPEHLTDILSSVFSHSEITSIRIPSGVKTIHMFAFEECRMLKTVYIPQSVTKISSEAFDETDLTDIFYEGSQTQWDEISIDYFLAAGTIGTDGIPSSAKIHYNSW